MVFDVITIFPKIFDSYFDEGILRRAKEKKQITVAVHNLREWTKDKHRTVDDTPYGGGAGMVLKVDPIFEAVKFIKSKKNKTSKNRVILFSAKGRTYTQKDAKRLLKYDNLIFICGRYEGVDERVAKHIADEELSIGNYVLTGGEIPAMIVADSVARLLPGVLGNDESYTKESHEQEGYLEHPHYTKPENFQGWKVPKVLLSGNHKEIEEWRRKNAKYKK